MTISFDPTIITSDNITISFDAVSETLPLVIIQHLELLRTINTIFKIISYIALGVFFLSLFHKIIGVEIITGLQLIYLSNAFYKKSYLLFNELRRLHMVTGYWALFHDSNDREFKTPFS